MKKFLLYIIIFAVVASFGTLIYKRVKEKTNKSEVVKKEYKAVPVEVKYAQKKDINDIRTYTGTLEPWTVVEISPKVGGNIEKLNFDIGNEIKNNEIILEIDKREFSQNVAEAKANLEVAKAQLRQAQVVKELLERDYLRQKALMEKNAISEVTFENSENNFKAHEVELLKHGAELRRRQAILETAQLKLDDCTLRATWDTNEDIRYVGKRVVDVGALVSPNQVIMTVIELDKLFAVIYVIERDYPNLVIGQDATLSTDAYPNKTFYGKVDKISKILEKNTRQAKVKIAIDNKNLELAPGMFMRVKLNFKAKKAVQVIPKEALSTRDNVQGVFLANLKKNIAYFVPVKTGIISNNDIEIVSPVLKEPVVTLGNHLLSNGTAIVIPEKQNSKKLENE